MTRRVPSQIDSGQTEVFRELLARKPAAVTHSKNVDFFSIFLKKKELTIWLNIPRYKSIKLWNDDEA